MLTVKKQLQAIMLPSGKTTITSDLFSNLPKPQCPFTNGAHGEKNLLLRFNRVADSEEYL